MPTRAAGVLLFLPVPLVLFLFTRAPVGILASLVIGILLMLTHRRYARPWAVARGRARCLWCGADVAPGSAAADQLEAADPLGPATWRACRDPHARAVGAALGWAARHGARLQVGILGTLGVFLAWAVALALGRAGPLTFEDAVAFFRLGIAATVLPLGWLAARAEPAGGGPFRSPFPLHVPALVGLRTVLWLFRLVGLAWLVQASLHVLERTGLTG